MKHIIISILAIMTSLTAIARSLTPEEALARIQASQRSDKRFVTAKHINPTLVYTQDTPSADIPAVYIFNNEGNMGYLVLSADDAVVPILGFSDNGNIDPDNLPDNFRWWIEEYASQIEWAVQHSTHATYAETSQLDDFEPIDPLCQTKWNQYAPYYNSTPTVYGTHCPTGCVATAMAQVMKYHNWPQTGSGSHSYNWNGETFSMNFENTSFDWGNMLNEYGHGEYSETQANAIASLMKACGISVNMRYKENESTANADVVSSALSKYFKYSCLEYLNRGHYNNEEWIQLLWENLKYYGPVIYNGSGLNSGGHCFVCDGYSSEGYFHFNWGWGGLADGYYKISALTPQYDSGTEIGDYSYYQGVTCHIYPTNDNCKVDIDFNVLSEIKVGKPFEIGFTIYNPNNNAIDVEILPVFYPYFVNKLQGYGTSISIHLEAKERYVCDSREFEFVKTPSAGTYNMTFCIKDGERYINTNTSYKRVDVGEKEEDDDENRIVSAQILSITENETFGEVTVNYELTAIKDRFDACLAIGFIENSEVYLIKNMDKIICEKGQTVQSSYTFNIPDPIIGKTYNFILDYYSTFNCEPYEFTLSDPAAIDDIVMEKHESINYFDTQGRKIESCKLTPGLYIKHIITKSGTKTYKVLIK